MKISRRDFIKNALLAGGSIIFPGSSFSANKTGSQVRYPAYAVLEEKGILSQRIEEARSIFEACELCPRTCGANRLKGELGFC